MKKNNAMSELNSRARSASVQRPVKAPKKGYKSALKLSAGFIRNICIAVAVLFICTIAVTAVIVLSPSEEKDVLVPDFSLNGVQNISEEDIAPKKPDAEFSPLADKYNVSFVFYKKDNITCTTSKRTVGELIDLLGIELDEHELMETDLDAVISSDTEVNVDNVSYDTVTEDYTIDYEIEYVDTEDLPKGTTEVHQDGVEGIRTVEYTVTYINGVEVSREQTDEYTSREPVTMIIYNGVGGMVNIGGEYYSYSAKLSCKSTVYSGGGVTASGIPASEDVIAVDPSVIPLGSRVYIEGVGFRTAADTGGAIIGNFIDIYYDEGNPNLYGYSNGYVTVYILD